MYIIKIYYEFEPNELYREIKEKMTVGKCFTMEELTHIFYNMIYAGSFLQMNSTPHTDIRPSYIHITSDKNKFKLGRMLTDYENSYPNNQMQILLTGKKLYMIR